MHRSASTRVLLAVTAFALPILRTQASNEDPPSAKPNRHAGGLLAFDVRDAETGQPIPCKLTFVGVEGTPRPAFTHNDIGRPEGELAIAAFDLSLIHISEPTRLG